MNVKETTDNFFSLLREDVRIEFGLKCKSELSELGFVTFMIGRIQELGAREVVETYKERFMD